MKQHQGTVYGCILGLRVCVVHLKSDKGACYPFLWRWTYGTPIMLSSENAGNIHLTKIDGEQVSV